MARGIDPIKENVKEELFNFYDMLYLNCLS